MALRFVAEKEHDGMTVLEVLRGIIGLSYGMIRHIKYLDDGIMLNGERVTVRAKLSVGDLLELHTEDRVGSSIIPRDLPIKLLYEDSELIVPDKPPFMPTHPSHDHWDDTLANALAYRYAEQGISFVFRPINRLDRNTSGLLLIAKNRISASKLSKSMNRGEIRKEYIAVLDGVLESDEGEIETYMRRSAESIIVREVCGHEEGADYALTKYRVLMRSENTTVVAAEPITGRTHQIRVHFASLGCPLVGDELYGRESDEISRHALHSSRLSFIHPVSNEKMSFEAPLHEDMRRLIEKRIGDFNNG